VLGKYKNDGTGKKGSGGGGGGGIARAGRHDRLKYGLKRPQRAAQTVGKERKQSRTKKGEREGIAKSTQVKEGFKLF